MGAASTGRRGQPARMALVTGLLAWSGPVTGASG